MNAPTPEFSRLINVARLSPNGIEESLEAKPDERKALAERFALIDLASLKAQLSVMPESRQSIVVTGTITAEVTQRCVITLEPITNRLAFDIDVTFLPAEQVPEGEDSAELGDLDEEIELFSGGKFDLGEMVAQQMGINLDPYPRKADAAIAVTEFGPKIEEPHPFAQLAEVVKIKKNKEKTKD